MTSGAATHPKAAQLGVVVGPAVSAFMAAVLGKAWPWGRQLRILESGAEKIKLSSSDPYTS